MYLVVSPPVSISLDAAGEIADRAKPSTRHHSCIRKEVFGNQQVADSTVTPCDAQTGRGFHVMVRGKPGNWSWALGLAASNR